MGVTLVVGLALMGTIATLEASSAPMVVGAAEQATGESLNGP